MKTASTFNASSGASTPSAISRGSVAYRRYMLGVLTMVYAFNFVDRNALGLLMQPIQKDLHATDTQMGLLSGIAFALFYSTLGIPIARWADRGNRVTIISVTTALWSAMVVCCAVATTFPQLLLARIGVAVGEAGCVPTAQSLIADYYDRDERPQAMAFYMLGGPISVVIGFAFAGWLSEWFGWRAAFWSIGIPGILTTLVVRFSLREPRIEKAALDSLPKTAILPPKYSTVASTLWRDYSYRHLVIGFTLLSLFSYGIAQWVPMFLIRTYHIGTGALGSWYALIWGGGGLVGTLMGGAAAARYASGNERLQLTAMSIALIGFIPLYLGIYLCGNLYVALGLMMVGAVIFSSIFGPLYAIIQDVIPSNMRAISVAIILLFSNLIGIGVGPLVVGFMSDALKPALGDRSLQFALALWTPGYLWAAFHLTRAGKYLPRSSPASFARGQEPEVSA